MRKKFFWINTNPFDIFVSKSTFVEMCNELGKNNFDSYLLTGYAKKPYVSLKKHFNVKSFSSINIPFLFRIFLLLKMLIFLLKNASEKDVLLVQPDALFIASIVKYIKGTHIHLDFRSLPVDIYNIKHKISELLFWKIQIRLFYKVPDTYSFITDFLRKSVEDEFNISFTNYILWSSGVNTKIFRIIKTKRKGNIPIIFYHGSITKNRCIHHVVKAIAVIKNEYKLPISFKIIGSGPYFENIQILIHKLKLEKEVKLHKLISYEKIPFEIAKADLCICPLSNLLEWNVSSPLKIFEYLACGKPVICTPIPAHKDVLGNAPFVVYSDDESVKSIVKSITESLQKLDNLKKYSREGRKLVELNFNWSILAERLATYILKNMREYQR